MHTIIDMDCRRANKADLWAMQGFTKETESDLLDREQTLHFKAIKTSAHGLFRS